MKYWQLRYKTLVWQQLYDLKYCYAKLVDSSQLTDLPRLFKDEKVSAAYLSNALNQRYDLPVITLDKLTLPYIWLSLPLKRFNLWMELLGLVVCCVVSKPHIDGQAWRQLKELTGSYKLNMAMKIAAAGELQEFVHIHVNKAEYLLHGKCIADLIYQQIPELRQMFSLRLEREFEVPAALQLEYAAVPKQLLRNLAKACSRSLFGTYLKFNNKIV